MADIANQSELEQQLSAYLQSDFIVDYDNHKLEDINQQTGFNKIQDQGQLQNLLNQVDQNVAIGGNNEQNEQDEGSIHEIMREYEELQKVKEEKKVIELLIEYENTIQEIKQIGIDYGNDDNGRDIKALNQLHQQIIQLNQFYSQLCLINPNFSTIFDNHQQQNQDQPDNSETLLINDKVQQILIQNGRNLIKKEVLTKSKVSSGNNEDKEILKVLLQILQVSQDMPLLSVTIKKLLFSKQIEKLQFHFLRTDSELNQIDHPEWMLKHVSDQLQDLTDYLGTNATVNIRQDVENQLNLVNGYLEVACFSIIQQRYKLLDFNEENIHQSAKEEVKIDQVQERSVQKESKVSTKHMKLRFIDKLLEYDKIYQITVNKHLSLMQLELQQKEGGQVNNVDINILSIACMIFEQNTECMDLFKEQLIVETEKLFNDSYVQHGTLAKLLQSQVLQDEINHQLISKFSSIANNTNLKNSNFSILFAEYFSFILNLMKSTINEDEFEMLSLQTKTHFTQFMDLIKNIKLFKKTIVRFLNQEEEQKDQELDQNFMDKSMHSIKDKIIQEFKQNVNSTLLDKLNQLIVTHFEQKVLPDHNSAKYNTQLTHRLKTYLTNIYPTLVTNITLKWALKITLTLFVRIRNDLNQIQKQFNRDEYALKQQFKELRFDLNLLIQDFNEQSNAQIIDFQF
eukprot:403345798